MNGMMRMSEKKCIAVDLDGTLAYYDTYKGAHHIGRPIPAMMQKVRKWLKEGHQVAIFTARASSEENIRYVKERLKKYGLPDLMVTNIKYPQFTDFFDDRAWRVLKNKGIVFPLPKKEEV
jgi:3-deoxy-D-manno-octulosonate 8-phosphate phosphatase KdsC-like HAD superfamily phosphatase